MALNIEGIQLRSRKLGLYKHVKIGSRKFYLPARYSLVVLLFFGTCATYVFRTNMSLTIVAMVKKTADQSVNCSNASGLYCKNDTAQSESTCRDPNFKYGLNDSLVSDEPQGSYLWSSETQGLILGGFFYGYTCTQIIMGRLADKLGPKWMIGSGMLIGSIFTMLVPLAAELGVVYLVTLRVLTGMTQGVLYPGLTTLFIRWIPETERSLTYGIISCGATSGIIICMPLVGWLCKQSFLGGWPSVFYLFGGAGCVWSIIWRLLSSNDPVSHPRISPEEKQYILNAIPDHGLDPKTQPKVPWKSLLTSTPVWAYVFTFACSSWVYYTRLTELPNYLVQILHSPIQENGYINAFVNLVSMFFTLIAGYVSDKILSKNWLTQTKTRKLMECSALIGSSACLLGVVISGCNTTAVIAFLTLASGFLSFANSGDSILAMDIAPALSGTIFGIANTICSVTGFLSPLLTGVVLDSTAISLTLKWQIVFYMSISIGLAGAMVAVFLWSADVQPWDPSYSEPVQEDLDDSYNDNDKHGLIINEQLKKF